MKRFPLIFLFIIVMSTFSLSSADPDTIPVTSVSDPSPSDVPGNDSSIPVDIIVMKSGFVSDIGTEYSRSFDMVSQDNPDSLIRPIIIDGGSNASTASAAWSNLTRTTANLTVVVTVASWTTNVVYPDAADQGIIQVALGSAAVNRSRPADHLIRFTPGVEQESPVLAGYLSRFDRIALIGGDNDYTNGYFSALDSLLPGKIIHKGYYNANNINSSLDLTAIRQNEPDVIVLLGFSEGTKVAELLRDGGITVPLAGTRGIESNILARTPAAEGLVFTTPALNQSHPFFSRYLETFGENATFYGAEGFNAMSTLYTAASACNGTPECMYDWYEDRTSEGPLGTVYFNEKRVASYPIELKTVRNGSFEEFPDIPAGT